MGDGLKRAAAAAKATQYLPIAVGDRIRDCDPRSWSGKRVLRITFIEPEFVFAVDSTHRTTRIGRHRIHESPTRRTGFCKVPRE